MLKIKIENEKRVTFGSIICGTIFKWQDKYYLKFTDTHGINVQNFNQCDFLEGALIKVCNAELIIKE